MRKKISMNNNWRLEGNVFNTLCKKKFWPKLYIIHLNSQYLKALDSNSHRH